MTVREVVGGEAIWIGPSSTMRDAARTLSANEVGALAVVREGQLIGILSERDIIRACAQGTDLDDTGTDEWMTREPDSLAPDMTVAAAAGWMLAAGYRHLPVVDGADLIGMVSIKDILWALTEPSAV
jgi:CBS domain-containing protein